MDHDAENITRLVIQLAAILFVAKIGGEVCDRFLKIPAVLGELGAGIIIGPFALGGLAISDFGPLFERVPSGTAIPVSESLYAISQIGAVVLLFMAGLETNLRQFLR